MQWATFSLMARSDGTIPFSVHQLQLTARGICSYFVFMPEPYWPKHKMQPYMLSQAAKSEPLPLTVKDRDQD